MKRSLRFYIKERHNPQIGVYYVGLGQLTTKAAKSQEKSLYGDNIVHAYDTQASYDTELNRLRFAGERVR